MSFGAVLLAMSVLALLAPLISDHVTHYRPEQQSLRTIFQGISSEHWLGTDELGRDTLTRLVWGARVSLGVGFLTVALVILLGGTIGIVAGYRGGPIDEVLMRSVDVLLAVPPIFLLILIAGMLPLTIGPVTIHRDALSLALILAFTSWGGVSRLVRAEVLSIRARDYVLVARSIGARDLHIMARHVVPNVLHVMVVAASLGVGVIILVEAALDFLGLGIQPPAASWGNMLLNAQSYTYHSLLLVALPGVAIMLAVLSANIFGNAVRDSFDPRLKR
jgi:peptide/nickel transport system permease protein